MPINRKLLKNRYTMHDITTIRTAMEMLQIWNCKNIDFAYCFGHEHCV